MNKLWVRLVGGFLLVALLVIGLVSLAIRGAINTSFNSYLAESSVQHIGTGFIENVETYYADNHTWEGVDDTFPERRGQREAERGVNVFVADVDGVVQSSTVTEWIGLHMTDIEPVQMVALHQADGAIVGYLGEQSPATIALRQAEEHFITKTNRWLMLSAGAGTVLALGAGLALAWSLTRPLQRLADDVRHITPADVGAQVRVGGTDEMRDLAHTFNEWSTQLAASEQARQRMTADIAHELRTPLTVMRGHVEAMLDGVYPLDMGYIAVVYNQILHLGRMVEDLRLLTRAESDQLPLNCTRKDAVNLLQQAAERFQPLADDDGITLTVSVQDAPLWVSVDVGRLQQVFDNLLANGLRHTSNDGTVYLKARRDAAQVVIEIRNTGTPISEAEAAHLFQRFWRADAARQRDSGGSGLGLAITRQLVRLHGGTISAHPEPDGTTIRFTLPWLAAVD